MLGYRMIMCLFVCLCLCLRWTWGLVCLVPRRLKCVGKTEHATSSESIAQSTMGTLSVDAKDVGKGERLSHNTMIQSLSNPLQRGWVRGKKIVLSAGKTNIKCFQGSCRKCNFYPDHIIKKSLLILLLLLLLLLLLSLLLLYLE